jgi:ABC-type sugar transport system substrate-binding protein
LKLRTAGRTIALATATVMLFAACSSGTGGSTAPSTAPASASTAASAAASGGGSAAAGKKITVGYLPKDIVNQYFAAAKTGIDKGADALAEELN